MRPYIFIPFVICLTVSLASVSHAQTPLPMGAPASGTATSDAPAVYSVRADSAGVLTVAVNGPSDLTIRLTDADGQTLPDGIADRDLNGSTGTEILSMTIAVPGEYRVQVALYGDGRSDFQIAGAFLAFPAFARPADPDARPSQATALQVGTGHDDALDTEGGDLWDWFVLTPNEATTLAVATRAAGTEIDLVLEVFLDNNFETPADRSDQDQQGDTANEAVTVAVRAGQQVHVRVSSAVGQAKGPYRISSSLVGAPSPVRR